MLGNNRGIIKSTEITRRQEVGCADSHFLSPDPILFCKLSIQICSGTGTNIEQAIRLMLDSA